MHLRAYYVDTPTASVGQLQGVLPIVATGAIADWDSRTNGIGTDAPRAEPDACPMLVPVGKARNTKGGTYDRDRTEGTSE